jgi:hypothetical protein
MGVFCHGLDDLFPFLPSGQSSLESLLQSRPLKDRRSFVPHFLQDYHLSMT